jgi:hypothetical protein
MYAVQKTIPLSFKEQLPDQQLPDRVFALILSSMIFFEKRDGIPSAEVLPRAQAIARLAMQRTTLEAPIKNLTSLVRQRRHFDTRVD